MDQGVAGANTRPLVLCLMGATATGKTALALELHERLPVEIVSVDASQVYRGMDIGTAKPSAAELARAPHRLIDIRDPSVPYSAAQFCDDARREIEAIHKVGRIPLLVGGTMFYFHSLEHGLSNLPSADTETRERLVREAEALGWPAMHARLTRVDPVYGAKIHPNDAQRIQRALEIIELTGLGPTSFSATQARSVQNYRFINLSLIINNRKYLHELIEKRLKIMLANGFVDEVAQLHQREDLSLELPSIRTVGYRQFWNYLSKNISYNEAVGATLSATRQLAKRQMTWLRSYPDVRFFDATEPMLIEAVMEYITVSVNASLPQRL